MSSRYNALVRQLYQVNQFTPAKLGLGTTSRLHELLDAPLERELKGTVVHVAGSNGKGSTCYKVAAALRARGKRVGLFVSPHVSSFRERIQVDGEPLSEADAATGLERAFAAAAALERGGGGGEPPAAATFFEIVTCAALRHFADAGVDAVVLECGLGGRLDSTNIVRDPAATAITSIGLEHTRVLGDTLDAILLEKAGIVKQGAPVVAGSLVDHAALRAVAEARGAGAYVQVAASSAGVAAGDFDAENTAIARALLGVVPARLGGGPVGAAGEPRVEAALATRPPCRFEAVTSPCGRRVVLDVAHNGDAVAALGAKLRAEYGADTPFRAVVALSSDKAVGPCVEALRGIAPPHRTHVTQADHARARPAADLAASVGGDAVAAADPDATEAVRRALAAMGPDEVLVVCGTIFIMADVREALGFDEPRDAEHVAAVYGSGLRGSQDNVLRL